jgi:hypothetical protein
MSYLRPPVLHRNFPERRRTDRIDYTRIARRYLPDRSINQLNGFYYNVWKNCASPLAREFEDTIAEPTRLFLRSIIEGWYETFEAQVPLVNAESYRCVWGGGRRGRGGGGGHVVWRVWI